MKLSDLLTEDARNQMLEDRHQEYLRFAAGFLGRTFPDDPTLSNSETRTVFARMVHARGRALGLQRQREHLDLLVQSVYCGVAFDANPLFSRAMRRAGWMDSNGHRRGRIDVEAFNSGMLGWVGLAEVEVTDPGRIYGQCRSAVQAWQNVEIPSLQSERMSTRNALIASLTEIWRDRVMASAPDAVERFADVALNEAKVVNLRGGMIVVHAVFALHLGLFFMHDPRYRTLATVIATSSSSLPDADIIAREMRKLMPLEKEQMLG